jgi:hypothetical protein
VLERSVELARWIDAVDDEQAGELQLALAEREGAAMPAGAAGVSKGLCPGLMPDTPVA